MALPSRRAYLSVAVGVVVVVVVGVMSDSGGSRKGREPVGEAWFVEGRRWNLTPAIRRKVYDMILVSVRLSNWCWWYCGSGARGAGWWEGTGRDRSGRPVELRGS